MKIKILGSGCATCGKLFELTKQAVDELEIKADLEHITDIQKIIELGIMSSPVMLIDEQVVLSGQVPDLEKIKEIITSFTSDQECPGKDVSGGCSCGGFCKI